MERYKEYKDSGIDWIGEIPSHWKIMPLKYCFNIVSGATPKTERKEFWDGEIIWITPADYKTEDHYIENGNRNITLQGLNSCGTEIVPKGSLIFSKRAPIGTISIANTDLCTNQGCLSCVPKDENESNFFYYLLTQPIKEFEILGSGATFLEISTTNFSNFDIPVPPLSEQKEIADYLDRKCGEIDAAVAKVDKELELLDELKQSEISKAVTKGLNPNVSFKPSGIDWIGEIPTQWKIMPLKRKLKEALMYGANEPAESDDINSPRYIRITDIDANGNLRKDTFKSLEYNLAQPYLLENGDILFARSGATVGKTFLFNESYPACFAGYLIKAKCDNSLQPEFLYRYTNSGSYENWKNSIFIQSTIQNIGADKYSLLPIPFPPLSEQKEIADYLDRKCGEIDSLKEKLKQKKEKLQELRQSLISEVVTGKRKVI